MKLKLVVLGHQAEILQLVPKSKVFMPVNLTKLDIREEFATNLLAENRFFLSQEAITLKSSADFVGVIPARWNERFGNWPPLEELPQLANQLSENSFIAPVARPIDARMGTFIRQREDYVHPGMSALLSEVEASGIGNFRQTSGIGHSVMANTFIVPAKVYSKFLDFWNLAFQLMHNRYGFNLPFTYRCAHCGLESKSGFGRYSSNRHAGYFYERVTCMFFQQHLSLNLIDPRRNHIKPELRIQIGRILPLSIASAMQKKAKGFNQSPKHCKHPGWPS